MLDYTVVNISGRYLVVYPTPGCTTLTVACDCTTEAQANTEVVRLKREQVRREAEFKYERELCDRRRIHDDLKVIA